MRWLNTDPASESTCQLIALYLRSDQNTIQVRLDFFQDVSSPCTITLAFDTQPGGTNILSSTSSIWDFWITLPSNQTAPLVYDSNRNPLSNMITGFIQDPSMDSLIFTLDPGHFLGDPVKSTIQVSLTTSDNIIPLAQSPLISSQQNQSSRRAPVVLVFWNTFPALTPAQALRRWDGAHSGPYGQRHGLSHLLDAVVQEQVPVVLLDLKTPSSISALDALGKLEPVRNLVQENLLLLPDTAMSNPMAIEKALKINSQIASAFDLPASSFVYAPFLSTPPAEYQAIFSSTNFKNSLGICGSIRCIPLNSDPFATDPAKDTNQPNQNGLTKALKILLLQSAVSENPTSITFLGGNLAQSAWADSSIAPLAFRYISNHPWIHPLQGSDLLTFPTSHQEPLLASGCRDTLCSPTVGNAAVEQNILDQLKDTPENELGRSAWLAYFSLTRPVSQLQLQELRLTDLQTINSLIKAANWAESPSPQSTCAEKNCILSNESLFAVFNTQDAGLSLLVALTPDGPIQLTGTSAQWVYGLSDSSEWKTISGVLTDPAAIPGSFVDNLDPPMNYRIELHSDQIDFITATNAQKNYRLSPDGLLVTYSDFPPGLSTIFLAVQPDSCFSPSWSGLYLSSPSISSAVKTWSSKNIVLTVKSFGIDQLTLDTSLDTLSYLSSPEDPDQAFPPGHYLPFPTSQLSFSRNPDFAILLSFLYHEGN